MADDYGYFGKGTTGYAHYMQAVNSTHGGGSGGGGNNNGGGGDGCATGCLLVVVVILILNFIVAPAMYR